MDFICISLGVLFILTGLAFFCGKGHTHLPAWKRMPPKEREKIRIAPLCRNIGEIVMLNGLIFLARGLCSAFGEHWFTISMIAWLVIAALDVWFIGRSRRYRNE